VAGQVAEEKPVTMDEPKTAAEWLGLLRGADADLAAVSLAGLIHR
jgi:hypothetical protein